MRYITRLVMLIAALGAWPSVAQDIQEVQDDPNIQEPVEATDQGLTPSPSMTTGDGPLLLDEVVSDQRLENRIRWTLDATGRYQALSVEVTEGVVFIRGIAEDETARTVATEISARLAGVAAVINTMGLAESPVWTLEPATQEVKKLFREVVRALPLWGIGFLIILITWFTARGISRLLSRAVVTRTDSYLLRSMVRKAVYLVTLIVGVYLALRVSGLTRIALTVVSGTGLVGLVLGFAFRDIAENFLASLLLSIQRPFRIGDAIEVDGHLGIVRKVTARGTLLIDFDGNHIQIANATVYKNTIKNYTANPTRRLNFTVGIGYDDVISHAQQVVRAVLDKHEAVLNEPEPLVLAEELGSSTINLRVYFWINGMEHSVLKMKSSVIRLVVKALTEAGVSMPDESREVIFPRGVPVTLIEKHDDGGGAVVPKGMPAASDRLQSSRDAAATSALAVEAEGDLTSEKGELERQADRARDPEEGSNVL